MDREIDSEEYEDCESDEEKIMKIAEDNNICIEIHTTSLENPIERYNGELKGESIRLYKTIDEESEEAIYQPIVNKETREKRNTGSVREPKRENRLRLKVHTNPDVKVLWNITSELDLTKNICSCIIDCEVVDNWFERFEEVKKFIDENKRKPSQSSKDSIEKKLMKWTSHQQENYKNKVKSMKNEVKYNLWIQFLEDYKEYFKINTWYEILDEVKQFMYLNKRRPSQRSKESKEKYLGSWITREIGEYNKNEMKDEKKYNIFTQFTEDYGKYFKDFDDIWYDTFKKLKLFIDTNYKTPVKESTNTIEKKLGIWFSNQKKNYSKIMDSMNDIKKYNLWTKFLENYKVYLDTRTYKWYKMFEELKSFIDKNHKKPSIISKECGEKKLCQWLFHQTRIYKYKKDGMLIEERYNLWTQFLEKYKKYFNNDDTQSIITESTVEEEQVEEEQEEEIIIIKKPKKSMKLKGKSCKKKKNQKKTREKETNLKSLYYTKSIKH